jgi:transposase
MRERKTFTKEFKLEAVRLLKEADKPAAQIAVDLGIRRNQLYKWRDQLDSTGDVASPKRGRPKKSEQSVETRLREENRKLKEENEILKKAAAYFARELK